MAIKLVSSEEITSYTGKSKVVYLADLTLPTHHTLRPAFEACSRCASPDFEFLWMDSENLSSSVADNELKGTHTFPCFVIIGIRGNLITKLEVSSKERLAKGLVDAGVLTQDVLDGVDLRLGH
eukprot:TRINITY_DN3552_c0_g1_i1.p1 TRINITY_DN3552_c0_g1~~TRINITY_DN3552_c0_g1_i1.p1  ORF type:complete len:123 (+),score=16.16 TRINITY_DN3552_c0_g1_i1:204-572(+)